MKFELLKWLSQADADIFATVSLKQAIHSDEGSWTRITPEQIKRTAWLLRDRLMKATVGKKKRLPFLAFVEGDGDIKRFHLHIITQKPSDMAFVEYSDTFRFTAKRLDWVYDEIDIRPIETGSKRHVISYSLKEGIGAFIPEASFISSTI